MKMSKMDGKIEIIQIIAFDIVPAHSKYNEENTCDRESMF